MSVLPAEPITMLRRGYGRGCYQLEFRLAPTWIEGGSEDLVLVATYQHRSPEEVEILEAWSFLGVMPGDECEVAVDVLDLDDQMRLYQRSLHKESRAAYDAWDGVPVGLRSHDWRVTVTGRVNGPNRDGEPKALLEAVVLLRVRPVWES